MDPHRVVRVPRPAQAALKTPIGTADDAQATRDAESLARRQREEQRRKAPPPVPPRQQERKQTPQSGGIEAQPGPVSQAELERRARVQVETHSPASFPPKVEERQQSPAPASVAPESRAPNRGDWAKLKYKIATAVVAALVLVIGALGIWAYTAIGAKTEAIKVGLEAKKKAETRDEQWKQWAAVVIWIVDCRDERDVRTGEMLLPDAQKMGSARKPEPWRNPCPTKLPPPP